MNTNSGELLNRYRHGDPAAADAIYQRYTDRLLALARSRLSLKLARRIDAEDVLQSAYRSFFVRAREGQFVAESEGDLWRLLATLTLHKLGRQAERHRAAKRSIDRDAGGSTISEPSLMELASREPSPVDVVIAAEELRWLLSQLEPAQRPAVQLRLEGWTLDEIAAQTGRSERTIRRWLADARQLLEQRQADAAIEGSRDCGPPEKVAGKEVDPDAPLGHADYHLERLIGSGGVCKVYVATQRSSGRRVAIKVLRKRLRHRPAMVNRFLNEARIVARFSHPAIVPVHGLGRLPGGGYFMVMDLVDGEDLASVCARGPIAGDQAAAIVARVAEAIEHAHERGVIHCDLKPGNVLIDRQSTVFVSDFGFAWLESDGLLNERAIAGTAGFMAPEQIDRGWGEIDRRTDVYGLGALLFMLLTGRPPFSGKTTSEVLQKVTGVETRVRLQDLDPGIAPAIRAACEKCLQRNPEDRFQSANAVARAIAPP